MNWNITDPKELEEATLGLRLKLVRKIGVHPGMIVVDVGCGQGGFTASLSRIIGEHGKVLAVDISTEYLSEFTEIVNKWSVRSWVDFVQADAANLGGVIADEAADMAVGYRVLEELKNPKDMPKIVEEMARIVRKNGRICLIELSTEARNKAEENYVRLHKESGDSLFEPYEIIKAMEKAKLTGIQERKFGTNIWFSPAVAKQNLEYAQVWFDADVKKNLGRLIDKYGMKYPRLIVFSGMKK
jgi:SAM-dependent methyltransferase